MYLPERQKNLVDARMKELEEQLINKQFVRMHKFFIIPLNKISGIDGNPVFNASKVKVRII